MLVAWSACGALCAVSLTGDDGELRNHSRNVALVVAYDGTDFHGFAESPDVATVMGTLRATLEQILQVSLDLTAAGRTDAGVHGWGQVVTGRLPDTVDLERLQRSVNRMCAPSIAIRFGRVGRRRLRRSLLGHLTGVSLRRAGIIPQPNPLLARTSWHVVEPLDLTAMNAAAQHLLGQHDFASFCRRPKVGDDQPEKSLVRILRAGALVARSTLTDVTGRSPTAAMCRRRCSASTSRATSFCHQMVRSIVGTLVDVGRGRREPDSIPTILAALDRSAAGTGRTTDRPRALARRVRRHPLGRLTHLA